MELSRADGEARRQAAKARANVADVVRLWMSVVVWGEDAFMRNSPSHTTQLPSPVVLEVARFGAVVVRQQGARDRALDAGSR